MNLESIVLALASGAAAYMAFCRIVQMNEVTTRAVVRHVYVLVALAGMANVFAVVFWRYTASWPDILFPIAMVAKLAVSRSRWAAGLPEDYRKWTSQSSD